MSCSRRLVRQGQDAGDYQSAGAVFHRHPLPSAGGLPACDFFRRRPREDAALVSQDHRIRRTAQVLAAAKERERQGGLLIDQGRDAGLEGVAVQDNHVSFSPASQRASTRDRGIATERFRHSARGCRRHGGSGPTRPTGPPRRPSSLKKCRGYVFQFPPPTLRRVSVVALIQCSSAPGKPEEGAEGHAVDRHGRPLRWCYISSRLRLAFQAPQFRFELTDAFSRHRGAFVCFPGLLGCRCGLFDRLFGLLGCCRRPVRRLAWRVPPTARPCSSPVGMIVPLTSHQRNQVLSSTPSKRPSHKHKPSPTSAQGPAACPS